MKKPWAHLYDRAQYKRIRLKRLSAEPLCRMCKERFDRMRPATVCDHIIPHKGDEFLFFSFENTQSLCKECHDTHKKRDEIGAVVKHEFNVDGYPK